MGDPSTSRFAKEVDADVDGGEQRTQQRADARDTLDYRLVLFNALLDLPEASGLAVAEERAHLGLERGEVGEDLLFEFSHFSSVARPSGLGSVVTYT